MVNNLCLVYQNAAYLALKRVLYPGLLITIVAAFCWIYAVLPLATISNTGGGFIFFSEQ